MYQGSHHLSKPLPHTELSMQGMNTMSCPLGDASEFDTGPGSAYGGADEEGAVVLETIAPSFAIGSEWAPLLSTGISEDLEQVASKLSLHGMDTVSCPWVDSTEFDTGPGPAYGGAKEEGALALATLAPSVAIGSEWASVLSARVSGGLRNEEGVVALATLAPSVTAGSEWPSMLSAVISEYLDKLTSRMTSK